MTNPKKNSKTYPKSYPRYFPTYPRNGKTTVAQYGFMKNFISENLTIDQITQFQSIESYQKNIEFFFSIVSVQKILLSYKKKRNRCVASFSLCKEQNCSSEARCSLRVLHQLKLSLKLLVKSSLRVLQEHKCKRFSQGG